MGWVLEDWYTTNRSSFRNFKDRTFFSSWEINLKKEKMDFGERSLLAPAHVPVWRKESSGVKNKMNKYAGEQPDSEGKSEH